MRKLSERNKTLLLMGANMTGSMVEGYYYAEEQLYIDEAQELLDFCEYIDREIKGCASGNIDMLFTAFKNPYDKAAQAAAKDLKKKIQEINNLINS